LRKFGLAKKTNWVPAFAGTTTCRIENWTLNKNGRHPRPRLREDRLAGA
jgi:hypothetical protein